MRSIVRIVKTGWIFSWAGLMTIILFFPIVIASLLGSTGNFSFILSQAWARVMLLVTGVRVRAEGREKIEKGRSYVIISNHQSQYDILALVTSLGMQYRWIIKQEIRKVPLFGYALYASRNIFIDRRNSDSARESIRRGLDRLPAGVSVMFFAEGTRSADGRLLEFKKGGFNVALERGLPILPVTVNGSRLVLPKGSAEFHSGRIRVVVGDPIDTRGLGRERMAELMAKSRSANESNLELNIDNN